MSRQRDTKLQNKGATKHLALERPVQRGLVRLRRVRRQVANVHVPNPLIPVRSAMERSRALTVEGLTPEAALHARRNFRLGVINGVLFTLVDALIAPGFVLAIFINRLGGSNLLVGLVPAIQTGGWFLPQIFVAPRVHGQPRVMHWYRRISVVRGMALVLLTIFTFLLANQPGLLLAAFFVLFGIYSVGAGISGIPWLEMVGKVVSPRRRGTFFSLRAFWGGLLAMLASGLISAILSERLTGLTFPYNFALLFGITTLVVIGGLWAWSSIHEPPALETAPPVTLRDLLRRGMQAVRLDRDYRSFMIARILLALASVSDPFYVVFARTDLGAPIGMVGLYLGVSAASSLLSNFVWGPLSNNAANRTLITATVISVALVPLFALAIPLLRGSVSLNTLHTVFALVFVFGGLAAGSARIVNNNMMLTIAPPTERAVYVGFLNTLLGFVTFVPVLGGALVDTVGFATLFVVSLVLALLAMAASTRMSAKTRY